MQNLGRKQSWFWVRDRYLTIDLLRPYFLPSLSLLPPLLLQTLTLPTSQDTASPVLSPQRLECPPGFMHYRRPSDEAAIILRNYTFNWSVFVCVLDCTCKPMSSTAIVP